MLITALTSLFYGTSVYLLNKKHANHKLAEDLVSIFGSANTSNRIALVGERFRLNQQLYNHKGGRPLSSYAMEYCLTLPKGYRPAKELNRISL